MRRKEKRKVEQKKYKQFLKNLNPIEQSYLKLLHLKEQRKKHWVDSS